MVNKKKGIYIEVEYKDKVYSTKEAVFTDELFNDVRESIFNVYKNESSILVSSDELGNELIISGRIIKRSIVRICYTYEQLPEQLK